MRFVAQLLLPFMSIARADREVTPARPVAPPRAVAQARKKRPARRLSARQQAYDRVVGEMKSRYGFRVRKWRRSMSGCAWELIYHDGRRQPMLEAPYPKSPLSCSIFLHEVGHHAIGLSAVKPRCLEELRAWQWSLAAMESNGLEIDAKVRKRMHDSMEYAVAKAVRRGVRSLPPELLPYLKGDAVGGRRGAAGHAKIESIEPG